MGTAARLDPASLATAGHYHPEAITLSVPPKGIENRNLWIRETLLSGTELVLVPRTGKGDPRVFDAVIARFWRGMSGEGFNPGQALAAAQRAFLLGRLMPGGKKTTDKDRHPSNWGNLQLMLRRL